MNNYAELKKINIKNIVALLFALRAISFVWLAFASDIYMPSYAVLVNIIRYSTILIGFAYILFSKNIKREYFIYTLPVIYYWLMLVFNTYGGYYGSYIQELICICCFLLMDEEQKIRIFKYFYIIIQICNLISLILYACYIINIPIFNVVPFYNDGIQTSYYHQFGIWAVMGDRQYSLPRLCSIFNEPGGLGTVCGLLFAATYSYSSKKEKLLLVITTICSFSMSGYIIILFSLAIHLWSKSVKYTLGIVAIIIFFLMIPKIDWGNDFLNSFAKRFEITSSGIAGNDRTNATFDSLYKSVLHSKNAIFGMGANYTEGMGTASIKSSLVQFGIVGFGIYIILWLLSVLRASKLNKNCLILVIVFSIAILQRPATFTNSYGYILLFGAISFLLNMNRKQTFLADN